VNGTLVLSIGETIEEVQDTGFLSAAPTLAVQQIGANALLQVHPQGIRHVLADRRVNEWRVPQGKTIVTATTNKRQVVVALSSAELVYFELDLDGQLNEYQDRKAMGSTVLALSIAEVPEGRQRTPYLVSFHMYVSVVMLTMFIGRGLRRPDRPNHLVGPRKHARDYQSSSINCSAFFYLYRLYVGCQYQQSSANHVREHWSTKWCLASYSS
jgi:Mono-functional DNA-alkylating methyl methanesulfonate N-term